MIDRSWAQRFIPGLLQPQAVYGRGGSEDSERASVAGWKCLQRAHSLQGKFGHDSRHNDRHLVAVNKAVKSRGAFLHNIMPLISRQSTARLRLTGHAPDCTRVESMQDSCEGEMNMMRHCRQCARCSRLLGEDRSAEFTPKNHEHECGLRSGPRQAYQRRWNCNGSRRCRKESRVETLAASRATYQS